MEQTVTILSLICMFCVTVYAWRHFQDPCPSLFMSTMACTHTCIHTVDHVRRRISAALSEGYTLSHSLHTDLCKNYGCNRESGENKQEIRNFCNPRKNTETVLLCYKKRAHQDICFQWPTWKSFALPVPEGHHGLRECVLVLSMTSSLNMSIVYPDSNPARYN